MAKAPLSKLRDLIRKYKPSVLPPDESKIGFAGDDMVGTQHTRSYTVQPTYDNSTFYIRFHYTSYPFSDVTNTFAKYSLAHLF